MTPAPRRGRRPRDRDGWQARASLGEGLRNLRDGALLGTALVGITTLVVGGALLADVVTATRVLRAESAYLDAGGDLLVAQAQGEGGVDAAACVALGGLTGVRAAFAATTSPGAATLAGRPESSQTVVVATERVLDLFGNPPLAAHQVLASHTIADRWQWERGSLLRLIPHDSAEVRAPGGILEVAGVVDLGLLEEGASTGVLTLGAATGQASACFVRIEPQYRDDLRAAIPAALGEAAGTAINVADRLPAGALAQDPAAAFDTRITRWAGAAAGAVVGLLLGVVAWTRRGRSALYASLGVPYSGGLLIRWTEGVAVVILGTLWGVAAATTIGVVLVDAPAALVLDLAGRGGALAGVVAIAVVVVVGLWRPPTLAALKDR